MAKGRKKLEVDVEALVAGFNAGETESSLARKFGIGRSTVHRRLVSAGVNTRDAVEATALRTHRQVEASPQLRALIDGLMLGDGWIEVSGNSSGRVCVEQTSEHSDWLDQLETHWDSVGVEWTRSTRKPRQTNILGRSFESNPAGLLRTRKYATFTEERYRWYPDGTKRVPGDVDLSPLALAHWYWGDGSTVREGYGMIFHTDGFTREEVDFLRDRLNELYGWEPTIRERRRGQFTLGVYKDRQALCDLIKPYCPPCFRYKLKVKGKAPSVIRTHAGEIKKMREEGCTFSEIGLKFGMTTDWARWACRELEV